MRLGLPVVWRLVAAFILFFVIVSFSFVAVEAWPRPPVMPVPHGGGWVLNRCDARTTWALDDSVGVRYVVYVANIFRGEWGHSLLNSCQPVTGVVLGHSADTLILTFGALAVSGFLARAVGPALARRHRRIPDAAGSAAALASIALPAAGLGLILRFALIPLGPEFVPGGDHSPGYASMPLLLQVVDYLGHLSIPFLAVVALSLGFLVLAMRNASLYEQIRRGPRLILDSLAGGPGAPGERRSAVPSLLPETAAYVGWTMSAALLVEIVFGLDGLGTQLASAAQWDGFAANGIFLFLSLLLVATLTAIDLLGMRSGATWLPSEPAMQRDAATPTAILRDFGTRPLSVAGLVLLVVFVGLALAAPNLVGAYDGSGGMAGPFESPSPTHLLGTGWNGVDVLSSVVAGGADALLVAAFAFGLEIIVGMLVAISTGIRGGRADAFMNWILWGLLCLPWLPLIVVVGLSPVLPGFLILAAISVPIPAVILRRDVAEILLDRGFPEPSPAVLHKRSDGLSAGNWTRGSVRLLVSLSPVIVSSALVAASIAVLVLAGSAFALPSWAFLAGTTVGWPGWETQLVMNWQMGIGTGAWFSMVPFILALFGASLTFALLGFSLREASLPYPLSRPLHRHEVAADELPQNIQQG